MADNPVDPKPEAGSVQHAVTHQVLRHFGKQNVPNISEAIRALLADALRDKGYLQISDEDASDKA